MSECGKEKNKLFLFLMFLLFTGSVFITSGKFVNATNTPKFYFAFAFLLAVVAWGAITRKSLRFRAIENQTILWGIYTVCFFQACYGLFQFVGWLPSNHSRFAITGSFDNPAGFAAVLSLAFPIGLFLLAKAKTVERYLIVAGLIVMATAVFLSGSRAGMLAMIVPGGAFLLAKKNILHNVRQFKYYKLVLFFLAGLLICGIFLLYYQKRDSADGRLLIWAVSAEMIKDKPVFGHGYRAFQAKYMDYQAAYFRDHPDSRFKLLADNVKHPFNEFIKVAVEFGIAGLAVILAFVLFVLWKIIKSKNENRELVLAGFVSFFVLACFSYPLQYVATWLFLAFYLSAMLPPSEIRLVNTPITIITRMVIVVVCIFALSHIIRQVGAELKWKTIAMSSLRGNTEEMLPEYKELYLTTLKQNPFFLYNYGAEMNVAGKFDESIAILTSCKKRFNDYDLQMLLADNYHKKGETEKAIQTYQHASNMIPCRFLPIYQLFEIYREEGQKDMAIKYSNEIINKKVKIQSSTVSYIQNEAIKFLSESKL
jgi:O-antigen ligase